MTRSILTLKEGLKKTSRSRDRLSQARFSMNMSLSFMYGPNAVSRLVRVQQEMDTLHATGLKKMLESSIQGMFK